ncbi:hypothetical protein FB45DRAFT_911660 [Roridomyces roridus]|uniref:ADF-H domain-containing protein n=1 Tax=Roridomyces roridus TaxID=1738132 RepID=A0AAD7BVK6_9AGAR|nr:hypothetical protein FB45DRAFT_911660 [Roridomyces roridus]
MSSLSGIAVSPELTAEFARACDEKQTRFIKVSIEKESLVHELSVPLRGSFQEDFAQLNEILQDDAPAYIMAKLDDPPAEWLAIYYVPDTAKVRDKMLYASSRASLLKTLGSTLFSDSIFATSKVDLTPEAYAAHRRHVNAPNPLSASEQEMADVRAAEREAGGLSVYQGSRARTGHIGQTAIKSLAEGDDSVLVIATIDMASETIVLHSSSPKQPSDIGSSLPADSGAYAFFAWKHAPSRRDIVYIYSCPSGSPVKQRMVYASGFNALFFHAKNILADSLLTRKIETSTPTEIDEVYLRSELDLVSGQGTPGSGEEKKPFARPRGPARRK